MVNPLRHHLLIGHPPFPGEFTRLFPRAKGGTDEINCILHALCEESGFPIAPLPRLQTDLHPHTRSLQPQYDGAALAARRLEQALVDVSSQLRLLLEQHPMFSTLDEPCSAI